MRSYKTLLGEAEKVYKKTKKITDINERINYAKIKGHTEITVLIQEVSEACSEFKEALLDIENIENQYNSNFVFGNKRTNYRCRGSSNKELLDYLNKIEEDKFNRELELVLKGKV